MNKTHLGRLIVLEGCDEVGKSSLAARLADAITESGRNAVLLSFPGKEPGTLGRWVYEFHHDERSGNVSSTCLQMLHVAAHADCIERQITPALSRGCDVVLDRYWWSTMVYGIVGGVPLARLQAMIALEKLIWANILPHAVFLIRRRRSEVLTHHVRIVEEYEELSSKEAAFYPVEHIQNDDDISVALESILRFL